MLTPIMDKEHYDENTNCGLATFVCALMDLLTRNIKTVHSALFVRTLNKLANTNIHHLNIKINLFKGTYIFWTYIVCKQLNDCPSL